MPTTRRQSGKLLLKNYEEVDVDFGDEEEIKDSKASADPVEDIGTGQVTVEAMALQKARPVFQRFTTKKKLDEGLCIVRALGWGKYEIVNLKHVDPESISSEETGLALKNDEARFEALDIGKEDWKLAMFKCEQAVKSASASIFRFQKLPIELRYRIYDFAIVSSNPLHKIHGGIPYHMKGYFALMETCKQIYQETRPFFYKNNFKIYDTRRAMTPHLSTLDDNLREVTFELTHGKIREAGVLKFLASCKALKILNVILNKVAVQLGGMQRWGYGSSQYRDESSVKKFRYLSSFNLLVDIRGLELVTVRQPETNPADITKEEIEAFQKFLNKILTQPRPEPIIPQLVSSTAAKSASSKSTSAKKTKKRSGRDDDDAYYP